MNIVKTTGYIFAMILFMFSSQAAYACSCAYIGSFINYTKNGGVVRATIKEFGLKLSNGSTFYESMTVEVSQVIKGEYSEREITFLGDRGFNCRAYVDSERFKIGSEHLISLSNNDPIQPLGGCGESAVLIKDGKVHGEELINNKFESYSITLQDYFEMLNAQ